MHLQPLGQGPAPWTAARNNGAIRTAAVRNCAMAEVEVSETAAASLHDVMLWFRPWNGFGNKERGSKKFKMAIYGFGVAWANPPKGFFKIKSSPWSLSSWIWFPWHPQWTMSQWGLMICLRSPLQQSLISQCSDSTTGELLEQMNKTKRRTKITKITEVV